jgi:hypothetical protein
LFGPTPTTRNRHDIHPPQQHRLSPMIAVVDVVNSVADSLFGPDSPVPWWAWAGLFAMLVWRIVLPESNHNQENDS